MAGAALPSRSDKRDAILRAAIDVFAERGFFNAQVADVARAAGVAAGTVYLYFRSKDDLLVSIFERSMREGLTEGPRRGRRPATIRASGCAASRAATSPASAATATSRSCSRSSCGSRPSSWSASPSTLLRDYLGLIREAIADGQRDGLFRADVKPTAPPRCCSARSTRWRPTGSSAAAATRSRPTPTPSSISSSTARGRGDGSSLRSAAVLGAGTMGAQIAAHFANAGVPVLLLDLTADVARDGLKRARALKPDPFFTPDAARADHDRRLRHRPREARDGRLDHRSGRRAARHQAGAARARRCRPRGPARSSRRTRRAFRSRRSPKAAATTSARHWLGTHFFNPPRYLHLLELIPTADTDPAVVERVAALRRSPPRQGRRRREGHAELHRATTSALYGVDAGAAGARVAAATRSRRSTRSPDRRSAGRRARRSGRWTSPASTCWRTSRRTSASGRRRRASSDALIERGLDRREGGTGLLQAGEERSGHRDPDARSRRR